MPVIRLCWGRESPDLGRLSGCHAAAGRTAAGADAICIFLQGCCGDINPLRMAHSEDRAQDFEVVEQVGAELATSVLGVLEQLQGHVLAERTSWRSPSRRARWRADSTRTAG